MIRYIRGMGTRSGATLSYLALAVLCVAGLNGYKREISRHYASDKLQDLSRVRSGADAAIGHPQLAGLFQSSFYFYFEEQFLPGIQKNLDENLTYGFAFIDKYS